QARLALDAGSSAHTGAGGTLELAGGLRLQSVAALSAERLGRAASVGKPPAASDPPTTASGDAQPFAAAWHTGCTAQTTWKIARLAQRQGQNARSTLCGDQKTQTGAKNASQTGLSA